MIKILQVILFYGKLGRKKIEKIFGKKNLKYLVLISLYQREYPKGEGLLL
jgi:hypothetical protein